MTTELQHFHGTPGDPGYPSLHPKGGHGKGHRRTDGGGMVGSDQFTEEEHYEALSRYIDESAGINSYLRHGEVQGDDLEEHEAEQYAAAIADLIEIQEPNTSPLKFVYRGMRSDVLQGLKPGDEFHDRGFISTSKSRDVARDFAGDSGIIVRIKVAPGSKTLNVDKVGATDPMRVEDEEILQSGTRFRVVSATQAGAGIHAIHYVLETIP